MSPPSKFQIMRRNRPKLQRVRETLVERINRLEAEEDAEFVDRIRTLERMQEHIREVLHQRAYGPLSGRDAPACWGALRSHPEPPPPRRWWWPWGRARA